MIQSDLVLQNLVVPLDPPAQLGHADQFFHSGLGRQGGEPVVDGLGLALWPLDQEPLQAGYPGLPLSLVRTPDPQGRKTRGQGTPGAFQPASLLPRIGWQRLGQGQDALGGMFGVHLQAFGSPPRPKPRPWRQWPGAGCPDRGGGYDPHHIKQTLAGQELPELRDIPVRRVG